MGNVEGRIRESRALINTPLQDRNKRRWIYVGRVKLHILRIQMYKFYACSPLTRTLCIYERLSFKFSSKSGSLQCVLGKRSLGLFSFQHWYLQWTSRHSHHRARLFACMIVDMHGQPYVGLQRRVKSTRAFQCIDYSCVTSNSKSTDVARIFRHICVSWLVLLETLLSTHLWSRSEKHHASRSSCQRPHQGPKS